MATSAINGEIVNVPTGFAVVVAQDRARLASPLNLASALVSLGAPARGVLSLITSGVLQMNDWTVPTGSRFLIVGATYYVGNGGRLSTSIGPGGAQSVGAAQSTTELSVNISPSLTPYTPVVIATVDADQRPQMIISSTVDPPADSGFMGDLWLNTTTKKLFGPRTATSWGPGFLFVT